MGGDVPPPGGTQEALMGLERPTRVRDGLPACPVGPPPEGRLSEE